MLVSENTVENLLITATTYIQNLSTFIHVHYKLPFVKNSSILSGSQLYFIFGLTILFDFPQPLYSQLGSLVIFFLNMIRW